LFFHFKNFLVSFNFSCVSAVNLPTTSSYNRQCRPVFGKANLKLLFDLPENFPPKISSRHCGYAVLAAVFII